MNIVIMSISKPTLHIFRENFCIEKKTIIIDFYVVFEI